MLNNFIYAKQKSLFEKALNNGEVLDEAIVFIEDTKEIWNHGTYFDCSPEHATKSELQESISNIENGNTIAKKAEQDSLGNNITGTYATKTELQTNTDNLNNSKISWIESKLDVTVDLMDNADSFGYVGNLENFNIKGDSVILDSVTSYIRVGNGQVSGNKSIPVWCRVLRFINDSWEIIYQSETSKTMSSLSEKDPFTFKVLPVSNNYIIKTIDKIAIVYVNAENAEVLTSDVKLGFRTLTNKNGGLSALLSNTSGGLGWTPAFTFKYFPTTSDLLVTVASEQTITANKLFNSGLSIAGKTNISSGIDPGELKIFPQGDNNDKGFIIRSANRGDNIPTVEILGTNTRQSYNYEFPKKGGTVALTNDIPQSLKNPTSLTFGSKTYDGSVAKEITAADLGLSAALKYCGTTTTTLTDGDVTSTVVIDGKNHTALAGCVVFYGDKEFAFNGSKWEEIGYPMDLTSYATIASLSNYKTKQTAVSDPTANGTTTSFIDTISQNANGEITVTKKSVNFPSAVTETTVSGWGFTKNNGTYIKPDRGIPASDLAETYITESILSTKGYITGDIKQIKKVTELPDNPDPDTLYIIL